MTRRAATEASGSPPAGLYGPAGAAPILSTAAGQGAAFAVVGFLAATLPLNTYWALGGTRGLAWVMGCSGCTVPLPLVWVQEAMVAGGIGVVLARLDRWRPPLPHSFWRLGLWVMAAAFGAVGAQHLLGDNTPQATFLFAPLALSLCVLSAVANRRLPEPDKAKRIAGERGSRS